MNQKKKEGFADRLYYLRKKVEMNQTEFAQTLGVSPGSISNYETEERRPGLVFFQKIKMKYNVNLNWLITGKGEMFDRDIKTKI